MAGSREAPSARRRRRAARSRRRSSPIGKLVNHLDQRPGVLDWRLRKDAVAQVEDVTRAAAGALEDVLYPLADIGGLGQEHDRVEIALHGDVVPDGGPA